MENKKFKELYRYYQILMLELFEEEAKSHNWKIIKRAYRSSYTRDLANLKLSIRVNANPKNDTVFNFNHSWLEFLYLDRDDKPLSFDFGILTPSYGMLKVKHIIQTKIEVLDAIVRDDQEKIDFLGKHVSRIRQTKPDKKDPSKEKVILHYENGAKQMLRKNRLKKGLHD